MDFQRFSGLAHENTIERHVKHICRSVLVYFRERKT
jgi:hypothetical protein